MHEISAAPSDPGSPEASTPAHHPSGAALPHNAPSQRLLNAIARGEVTKGGLAEAGWFDIGTIAEDGVTMRPSLWASRC